MGLVRTFVWTETRVAMDAVGTVFDCQRSDVGIVLPDGRNQRFTICIPTGLHLLITLLIGQKPLPVVVARKGRAGIEVSLSYEIKYSSFASSLTCET